MSLGNCGSVDPNKNWILKGLLGQIIGVYDYWSDGFGVIPNRYGSDLCVINAEQLRHLTGELVEIKTGQAKLSPLQRKLQRLSEEYRVYRVSDSYMLNFIETFDKLKPYLDGGKKY